MDTHDPTVVVEKTVSAEVLEPDNDDSKDTNLEEREKLRQTPEVKAQLQKFEKVSVSK